MQKITLPTAQEHSRKIGDLTSQLNSACAVAMDAGMTVEIDVVERQHPSGVHCPVIHLATKVNPEMIEIEEES